MARTWFGASEPKSIELFGNYVIPTFKNPRSIVRKSEEILADIRTARPAHYAEVEAYQRAAVKTDKTAAKKANESVSDPAASA